MEMLVKLSFFLVFVAFVLGENGCPHESYIIPCTCTDANTGFAEMTCKGIENTDTVLEIFRKTQRYNYLEVKFESSTFQFMPTEVLSTVSIYRLYLLNVTLTSLFDSPPNATEVQQLLIVNSTVVSGVRWEMLQKFTKLTRLELDNILMENVGTTFTKYVPRTLTILTLKRTRTKQIKTGVFKDFSRLNAVEVSGGRLTSLRRDSFSSPSPMINLYFNDNQLTSIPDDLFTNMPNLIVVYLHNNKLTSLPESAFDGRSTQIWIFAVQGNPLMCDCQLLWLIKKKPEALYGSCAEPPNLKGKELKDLKEKDFNC